MVGNYYSCKGGSEEKWFKWFREDGVDGCSG